MLCCAGADLQSLPEDELQQLLAAYETAAAASDAESPARVRLLRQIPLCTQAEDSRACVNVIC